MFIKFAYRNIILASHILWRIQHIIQTFYPTSCCLATKEQKGYASGHAFKNCCHGDEPTYHFKKWFIVYLTMLGPCFVNTVSFICGWNCQNDWEFSYEIFKVLKKKKKKKENLALALGGWECEICYKLNIDLLNGFILYLVSAIQYKLQCIH